MNNVLELMPAKNTEVVSTEHTDKIPAKLKKFSMKQRLFREVILDEEGGEKEKDYGDLLQGLIQDFAPQGKFETVLVEKIAVDLWRLKRLLTHAKLKAQSSVQKASLDFYKATNWNGDLKHYPPEEMNDYIRDLEEAKGKEDAKLSDIVELEKNIENAKLEKKTTEIEYAQAVSSKIISGDSEWAFRLERYLEQAILQKVVLLKTIQGQRKK